MDKGVIEWDPAMVRTWLNSRIAAARADQVTAQRGGREREDDCDAASAEELVCTALRDREHDRESFVDALKKLLERDEFVGRGVYDDRRFDRHVRTYARKLVRMAKSNDGFGKLLHHQ